MSAEENKDRKTDLEKRTGSVKHLSDISKVEAENMYVVLELILDHLTMRENEHNIIEAQVDLALAKLNKVEALLLKHNVVE